MMSIPRNRFHLLPISFSQVRAISSKTRRWNKTLFLFSHSSCFEMARNWRIFVHTMLAFVISKWNTKRKKQTNEKKKTENKKQWLSMHDIISWRKKSNRMSERKRPFARRKQLTNVIDANASVKSKWYHHFRHRSRTQKWTHTQTQFACTHQMIRIEWNIHFYDWKIDLNCLLMLSRFAGKTKQFSHVNKIVQNWF